MFCPVCQSEFRAGVVRCEPCGAALVQSLSAESLPTEADPEMTVILRTNNQPLLAAFESVLTAAGIPFFVRGEEAASLMPINAVLVVPKAHSEAALELLEGVDSTADDD